MSDRKAAIVTGARRGIGRATAFAMADAGFDLIVTDLVDDSDTKLTTAGLVERGARHAFLEGNISDLTFHETLVDAAYDRFSRLDCLVNNAGVMSMRDDLLDTLADDFDRVLGINLRGTFFLTQLAARRMIAEAEYRQGRSIVTITSANAVMTSPEKAPYCISKSALSMVVKMFALRLAMNGIAAFEIRPGLITTEMSAEVKEKYGPQMEAGLAPVCRWGQPSDVGKTIASLATGALAYTIGQPINVDGGMLLFKL